MTHRRGLISLSNAIFLAIIVAAIAVIALVRTGGDTSASDDLFAQTATYADAQHAAADQDKLVFVLATADWCGPCQALRAGPLADPSVQSTITSLAVPYKLDVTNQQLPQHDAELAASLGVSGIPALYVIDTDNRVLASTVGNIPADDLTRWLHDAAARN